MLNKVQGLQSECASLEKHTGENLRDLLKLVLTQIENLNTDLLKNIKEENHENESIRSQMQDITKSKSRLQQETQMTDIKVAEIENHVGINE